MMTTMMLVDFCGSCSSYSCVALLSFRGFRGLGVLGFSELGVGATNLRVLSPRKP